MTDAGRSRAVVAYLCRRADRLCRTYGDRLETKVMRRWVALRSARCRRTFAEIRASRRRVDLFLLPERYRVHDPAGLARVAPPSQGWGWFRTKVTLVGRESRAAAFRLVRQSYLYARSLPHARRR